MQQSPVRQSSITLAGPGLKIRWSIAAKFKDVNGDLGRPDLTCRFSLRHAGFQAGNTVGVLRFNDTTRGIPLRGAGHDRLPEDDQTTSN